ncbi:hypothetical protein Q7P37_002337 [Cladosporium fusiforme]
MPVQSPLSLPVPPRTFRVRQSGVKIVLRSARPSGEGQVQPVNLSGDTPAVASIAYETISPVLDCFEELKTAKDRYKVIDFVLPRDILVGSNKLYVPFDLSNLRTRHEVSLMIMRTRHVHYLFDRVVDIHRWLAGMDDGALEQVRNFTIWTPAWVTKETGVTIVPSCSHSFMKYPYITVRDNVYHFGINYQGGCCEKKYSSYIMDACADLLKKIQSLVGSRSLVHHPDGDKIKFARA